MSAKRFWAVFLMLASMGEVGAYPIPPQSLQHLIRTSELIVHAKVEGEPSYYQERGDGMSVEAQRKRGLFLPLSMLETYGLRSKLRIKEVLKGEHPYPFVLVDYESWVCPEGPSFPPGAEMMVFLVQIGEGRYTVVGLSYGAVAVSAEGAAAYKGAIQGLLALEKRNPADKERGITEWLVTLAQLPFTRKDAALDLLSLEPLPNPSPTTGRSAQWRLARYVTTAQWGRISNAVMRAESLGEGELAFMEGLNFPRKQSVRLYLRALKSMQEVAPPPPKPARSPVRLADRWITTKEVCERMSTEDILRRLAALLPSISREAVTPEEWLNETKHREFIAKLMPVLEDAARAAGFLDESSGARAGD